MRIKLLIAVEDINYAERLSNILSDKYADAFEVTVCGLPARLRSICESSRFDIALIDYSLAHEISLRLIRLPLLLYSEDCTSEEPPPDMLKIRKYQRVSSIADEILALYSKISADGRDALSGIARIIAFWSPSGGVGTTTAALAYCANKAESGTDVLYLNLESFSSSPFYFSNSGKSISSALEMLEAKSGNLKMFIRSIRRQDTDSGISYFCQPENFDDMNILSIDDTASLITACSGITDELVIDLSCICNKRTWQIFEFADKIMITVDTAGSSQIKLEQFIAQHNVYERIKNKALLVANKGAHPENPLPSPIIHLPFISPCEEKDIYKKLSVNF